jgi:hypothetical protein
VRLRGGEGQHTLVLVDGVRVEDPSAPSGGFDFGTLTSSGIERIEVLRGSNSVVWGSSAIGGVIAVTTREIDGVEASAEAGSRRSYDADAVAGVKREAYAFSLNGGYATTDGVSAAASGTERDGYDQWRGGKGASTSPTRSRWSPMRAMPMARPRSMAMTRISTLATPRIHHHAAVLRPRRAALCRQRADARWRLQHCPTPAAAITPAGPTTRSNMATTAAASARN